MSTKPLMPIGDVERAAAGRAVITRGRDSLAIEAPGARNTVWIPAAAGFGVPWLVAMVGATVWYLGWGIPDRFVVRLLLWLVTMLLMIALHALAVLSIWAAVYARVGVETLVIDPAFITVIRRAGRLPIRLHIPRTILERASLLPSRPGRMAHPRIEMKAWRAAIRFGAGLTEEEARQCLEVINRRFERDEAERHEAEVARGLVFADREDAGDPTPGADDGTTAASPPTSVMRAYREALDSPRGRLRSRFGALGSGAKRGTGGSRRAR